MKITAEKAFIGVGSNMGEREENCLKAIKGILEDERATFLSQSSLYVTSPVSCVTEDDFINCVLAITWTDTSFRLLRLLNDIENSMGRQRTVAGAPRVIDLDILLFGDVILEGPKLTIPHPRLHERKFALIPCLEIEPSLIHPLYKKPLQLFLHGADETQRVTPVEKAAEGGKVER